MWSVVRKLAWEVPAGVVRGIALTPVVSAHIVAASAARARPSVSLRCRGGHEQQASGLSRSLAELHLRQTRRHGQRTPKLKARQQAMDTDSCSAMV